MQYANVYVNAIWTKFESYSGDSYINPGNQKRGSLLLIPISDLKENSE